MTNIKSLEQVVARLKRRIKIILVRNEMLRAREQALMEAIQPFVKLSEAMINVDSRGKPSYKDDTPVYQCNHAKVTKGDCIRLVAKAKRG